MAENKKSFLLYCDLIHTIEKMPNEKAGELFKHILQYVNDKNPTTDDLIIQLTFEPIRQQLKRDLIKWTDGSTDRVERAKKAGVASGIARELKRTQTNSQVQNELNPTKRTVSVTVSDTVTDTVNDIVNDNKNNIDSRKLKFADSLKPFLEIYGRDLLNEFYDYWIEPNISKTKLKFEMQKTWDVSLRLKKWSSNNFNNKNNGKSIGTKAGQQHPLQRISDLANAINNDTFQNG